MRRKIAILAGCGDLPQRVPVAGWTQGPVELGLTVNNLLDAEWREAQFAEESRVSPTSEIVEDVHFTPGMPTTVLATATYPL